MNAPTSSTAPDKSLPVHPDVEAEIRKLAGETIPKRPAQLESEVERIRSSITRLTSSSIDGLQELTSELQELQRFLNSEVQRVQAEIDGALAGISIIIDTIAPWKSNPASSAPTIGPASSVPVPGNNRSALRHFSMARCIDRRPRA
jgi:hypothetical protein